MLILLQCSENLWLWFGSLEIFHICGVLTKPASESFILVDSNTSPTHSNVGCYVLLFITSCYSRLVVRGRIAPAPSE